MRKFTSKNVFLTAVLLWLIPATTVLAQDRFSDNVAQFISVERGVVALENVTILDGTGAEAVTGQTIILDGQEIAAIGPAGSIQIPSGATRLDLTGHTVIPGMVGLHNHTYYTTSERQIQLSYSAPMLYLASGVTTIRTTGSYAPYAEINLKQSIDRGDAVGPAIFVTGPYITGGSGMSTMTRLSDGDDARRVVRYWAEEGVSWFKAYNAITREELGAAIDEAHQHGVKVTGHLCSVSFIEAVELGIDNLEHGFFTNTDYDETKQPDRCPSGYRGRLAEMDMGSDEIQETFRTMIDAGVGMTSTLSVYEMYIPNRPPLEQRVLDAMSPETQKEYLKTRSQVAEANNDLMGRVFKKSQEFEKAFVEAGGLLASGVDPTGYGGALPGYGDQRNFELLLEGGFTVPQVVKIVSANGAIILGIDDQRGTVQEGKIADLVIIDGDLLSDPASIRNVSHVFKNGVGFDSPAMIAALNGLVGIR